MIWFEGLGNSVSKYYLETEFPSVIISPTSLNAAVAVAKHFGVSDENIKKTIKNFKPLEGRFEKIGESKGVIFINDTTSTNPGATLFNLKNYLFYGSRRSVKMIYLILGGENKGFKVSDYKELVDFLAKNRQKFKNVLLVGSATELMKKNKAWNKLDVIIETDKMEKAVKAAFQSVGKNDVILLSPASASFNLFTDEFQRGRVFKKAFLKLK